MTPIKPDKFDFEKWYAEQDAIARGTAESIGTGEANEKWSKQDYVDAHMKYYENAKGYAKHMTEAKGVAWIASAHGGVQPAQEMLGDQVGQYLK